MAFADSSALPYSLRRHPYSGFNTPVAGDIRTVGMGGATIGLGDTFLASTNNPAGLAMTLNGGDTNITHNLILDGNLQNNDEPIEPGSAGIALNVYPWGFSFGAVSTGQEVASHLAVHAREYRLALARVSVDHSFALGMSLNLGRAEEEVTLGDGNQLGQHAHTVGATLGAMTQLPYRVLLSTAYTFPMHYRFTRQDAPSPAPLEFYQPMEVPARLSLGVGWIPNRFIRGNFELNFIGLTKSSALLSDDGRTVGANYTVQPRLGGAYVFMDFHRFQGTVFGGVYFETSRIQGASNRLHATQGIEAKADWITAGIGYDHATQYRNLLYSVGIDLGYVLETLELIPKFWKPKPRGIFPNPFVLSDQGLARPLVKKWVQRGPEMDPVQIILDLPKNVEELAH